MSGHVCQLGGGCGAALPRGFSQLLLPGSEHVRAWVPAKCPSLRSLPQTPAQAPGSARCVINTVSPGRSPAGPELRPSPSRACSSVSRSGHSRSRPAAGAQGRQLRQGLSVVTETKSPREPAQNYTDVLRLALGTSGDGQLRLMGAQFGSGMSPQGHVLKASPQLLALLGRWGLMGRSS